MLLSHFIMLPNRTYFLSIPIPSQFPRHCWGRRCRRSHSVSVPVSLPAPYIFLFIIPTFDVVVCTFRLNVSLDVTSNKSWMHSKKKSAAMKLSSTIPIQPIPLKIHRPYILHLYTPYYSRRGIQSCANCTATGSDGSSHRAYRPRPHYHRPVQVQARHGGVAQEVRRGGWIWNFFRLFCQKLLFMAHI